MTEPVEDPPRQYLVAGPPRLLAEVAARLADEGVEVLSAFPSPTGPERLVVCMRPDRAERLRVELGDQLIVEPDLPLQQYADH